MSRLQAPVQLSLRSAVVLLSFRPAVVLWSLEANVALQQRLRAHAAAVLRVVLAWKRSVCVLCSSAVDEPSSSADALQHCLQNLVGVRPSVLCSNARAGAGAVVLCSSFGESKQARSVRKGSRALQQGQAFV